VTGDKELLSLKHHKSTRIVTPAAMLVLLMDTEKPQQTVTGSVG
jgi:predicted nucleic acid-binding protein